jgi:hypothetical protein
MTESIKKETYVEADAKTTKALTFDMMHAMFERIDSMVDTQEKQVVICNTRMGGMERKRKSDRRKDTAVSATSGFFGGAGVMVAYYIKQWLSKS